MAAASPSSVGRVFIPYLIGRSFVCVCCFLSFPCASGESGSFFQVTICFLHAFHSRAHSKVSPSPCLFQAGHTELFQPFLTCHMPELQTAWWSPITLVPVCCYPSYPGEPKTGHRTPKVVSPVPSREEGSLPWVCQLHLTKSSQEANGLFCHKATPLAHGQLVAHQEAVVITYPLNRESHSCPRIFLESCQKLWETYRN